MSKSDLLKEIEKLNYKLDEYRGYNSRLINEKAAMIDNADDNFENSSTYKQMNKEIEEYRAIAKRLENNGDIRVVKEHVGGHRNKKRILKRGMSS